VRKLVGAVTLVTALALPLGAQVIPGFPGGRSLGQLQPVKRDTSKDTTNKVHWPAPDSITARLLARPGYTITRYQGDTAFFNAQTHALDLLAANKRRAIVDRDSQIVVSDSGIYYTEADRKVVTGGKYTLSPPPSSGQADIKGVGRVDYDLADRSARITRAKLPVNNGQMWYMDVALARVILDTGKTGSPTVFARGGSATLLRELSRSNMLLTPLDRRDEWFRFHPLFREMLRATPPYFIKAGEAQSHALMIALDDLWLKPATTYKISYGTGPRDEKTINGAKQRLTSLPATFNDYSRWLGNMWSNTLYYSTVDY